MATLLVLGVLTWIALGCFMLDWLTRQQGDDTPNLIIAAVIVYFGVPMLAATLIL